MQSKCDHIKWLSMYLNWSFKLELRKKLWTYLPILKTCQVLVKFKDLVRTRRVLEKFWLKRKLKKTTAKIKECTLSLSLSLFPSSSVSLSLFLPLLSLSLSLSHTHMPHTNTHGQADSVSKYGHKRFLFFSSGWFSLLLSGCAFHDCIPSLTLSLTHTPRHFLYPSHTFTKTKFPNFFNTQLR